MDQTSTIHEETPGSESRTSAFRYGIRWLLILVFLVAILLACHEAGRRSGYQDGFEVGQAEEFDLGQQSMMVTDTRSYRVPEFWTDPKSFASIEELMKEIQSEVAPKTWEANGGKATIAPYPQNQSLIISQSSYGHDELVEFIERRRVGMQTASAQSP